MKSFDTLTEAMQALRTEGYIEDLNLKKNCLECKAKGFEILAKEFEVDQMYRFEGDSNPDDSSILFAISSESYKLKGLLVDAYGMYSDPLTSDMISKLKYKPGLNN